MDFLHDERFAGIKPFEKKVWLSSPTMHGEEQKWVDQAIQTNWVSTVGENINEVERLQPFILLLSLQVRNCMVRQDLMKEHCRDIESSVRI